VLICARIIEQPFKIPFVAAVIFYGNQVKTEIAAEAIKRAGEELQAAFNAGQWTEFKLFLRFFACLQSLFEGDGIFAFLQQIFDTVVDLQSENENDVSWPFLCAFGKLTVTGCGYRVGQDHPSDRPVCSCFWWQSVPREGARSA
jgi:hypothetical protein